MAHQNKSVTLNKFKRIANNALRMEREISHLDVPNLNKTSKNRHDTNPQVELISMQGPQIKRSPLGPSYQPPCSPRDTNTTKSDKMLNTQKNIQRACKLDKLLSGQAITLRSLDGNVYLQRIQDDRVHSHHPKYDHVYQCRSKDDELLNRHQVKKVHEHTQHPIRVARAAAAAAASTVVAQLRKDAIAAVARQHAPYNHMAAVSRARSVSSSAAQTDKRRVTRNSNLLSSALSIIREMDPASLETLCYAIHDQVTNDPSESG